MNFRNVPRYSYLGRAVVLGIGIGLAVLTPLSASGVLAGPPGIEVSETGVTIGQPAESAMSCAGAAASPLSVRGFLVFEGDNESPDSMIQLSRSDIEERVHGEIRCGTQTRYHPFGIGPVAS
ncbi:MAG: hypothetical protein IT335_11295 [Thermomicrobiales bacterium]|nr:hypothetical protein [Thermomicrobiales bacterium]